MAKVQRLDAKGRAIAALVGRRIRQLRTERQWNQVDLEAHLSGIKRATISDFETARSLPSLLTLFDLASAFGVEPGALLMEPDRQPRHRVAVATLQCSEATLKPIAKLLDVSLREPTER